jgi:uncharacterized protein YraI
MRKTFALFVALCVALAALAATASFAQNTGVVAEAVGSANLRAGIGTDTDVVGTIETGIRYPVVGRSAQFPWLLLGDIVTYQPIGWVFADLVTVSGDLGVVPLSEVNVTAATSPPPMTFTPTATLDPAVPTTTPEAVAQPTATAGSGVYGNVLGEINLRYGPGADYPRLGGAFAGDRLEIVGYHATLAWVLVTFPDGPGGTAWVSRDVIEIVGDVTTTRPIVQTNFTNLPTLTPTAAVQQTSSIPRDGAPVPVSPGLLALGNLMWDNVLNAGFDPDTSKFAAMYLLNLATGEEITFGNQYAFSGTSINKIAILTGVFSVLDSAPEYQTAVDILNTVICSENSATNNLLSRAGSGDMYRGAEQATRVLNQIGLRRTFITAPFEIPGQEMPQPTSPIRYPDTDADQVKARPDVTNQMTVDEMGYLLSSLYECAYEESGPFLETETGLRPQECRKILYVMANNTVDAFAKAGVPQDITVAHKHGWTAETHGNAAIVFTPNGDYVLVMMMYQPTWLVFQESLPMVAETSRLMFNYLNPELALTQIRDGFIPETQACNFAGTTLADEIASPFFLETNTGAP